MHDKNQRSCRRTAGRIGIAFVIGVAGIGLSGCGIGGGDDANADSEVGPIEAAYELNSQIVQAEYQLQESTIQSCMKERGFDYVQRKMSPEEAAELSVTQRADNASVREDWYGYRDGTAFTPPTTEADPNQAQLDQMDSSTRGAFQRALTVDSEESPACQALGEDAAVRAVVGPATEELGDLYGDLMVRVSADPKVAEAQAAWRQCMAQAGFNYENREAIVIELKEALGKDGPVDAKTTEAVQTRAGQLAEADVTCDESAGLEKVTRSVQIAMENDLAESESELLKQADSERNSLLQESDQSQ